MPKYVAFLRAINLGGHNIKMDYLRGLFEEMGFSSVETYIASGNVLFKADSSDSVGLESKINETLHARLGYGVASFIRTLDELAEIAAYPALNDPGLDAGESTLYIAFLGSPPGEEGLRRLLALATEVNQFQSNAREIYWLCRTRFSDSGFSGAQLEKALGMPSTIRNVSTVKKIVEKYT